MLQFIQNKQGHIKENILTSYNPNRVRNISFLPGGWIYDTQYMGKFKK